MCVHIIFLRKGENFPLVTLSTLLPIIWRSVWVQYWQGVSSSGLPSSVFYDVQLVCPPLFSSVCMIVRFWSQALFLEPYNTIIIIPKVKVRLIMDSLGDLHSQQEAAFSDHLMDLETAAVMKERVASSTRKGYEFRNVAFMIWLFDSNGQYHNTWTTHL